VRFVLYTDKTVSQCMSALNERLHTKGTGSRPTLDGWVEKGGRFSLAMSSKVARRFTRKTQLRGEIKREDGVTVIQGDVPSGAPRRAQLIIYGALVIVGILLLAGGNAVLAIVTALAGAYLYVPLTGDHHNSAILVSEVQRALKARQTPPRKPDAGKSLTARKPASGVRSTATRPAVGAARKPASSSKPPAALKK